LVATVAGSAGFVTVFGVGVGLGATVRVRVEGVPEFVLVFCAHVSDALARITETITRNLLTIVNLLKTRD
jgi:hypothetical protein